VTVYVNPADPTRVQNRHEAIVNVVVMPPITAAVPLAPVIVVVWFVRQRKRATRELIGSD